MLNKLNLPKITPFTLITGVVSAIILSPFVLLLYLTLPDVARALVKNALNIIDGEADWPLPTALSVILGFAFAPSFSNYIHPYFAR